MDRRSFIKGLAGLAAAYGLGRHSKQEAVQTQEGPLDGYLRMGVAGEWINHGDIVYKRGCYVYRIDGTSNEYFVADQTAARGDTIAILRVTGN